MIKPIDIYGEINVTPEMIRYDERGVHIREKFINESNPRLAFAKLLELFEDTSTMITVENITWRSLTVFGNKVKIGQYTVIGADGFGYEREQDGTLFKMPHRGSVIIEDDVTIGNQVSIDRAVTAHTVIGAGTKIDNLVHIAHGVQIGKNCLVVAGTVVGGSAVIGDNCFIGINASIKNKVKIGNNVTIGMGAVVTKDIPDGETCVGNPARKLDSK